MPIVGSLDTFSLPELFQIIDSGKKTGKLSFKPSSKNKDSKIKGTFEIWFQEGNFITIIHSFIYQGLITEIRDRNWADNMTVAKTEYSCPTEKALGSCFIEEKVLSPSQNDSLFKLQVDKTIKLFDVEFAWFKFEETNVNNVVSNDSEIYPWKEMTGNQKKATQLALEAMRNFSSWQRFAEDMPSNDCGLQKLVNNQGLELNSLESHLWDAADSLISLKKISQEKGLSIETVQQTALSMILAGLVEEVPVNSLAMKAATVPTTDRRTTVLENTNLAVTTKANSQASPSLINNLVSFLRNKF